MLPPKWRSSTLNEISRIQDSGDSDDLEVAEIFQNEIQRQEKETQLLNDLKNENIGESSFEAKHVLVEGKEQAPVIVRMRTKPLIRRPVPPVIQRESPAIPLNQEIKPISAAPANRRLSADFSPLSYYVNAAPLRSRQPYRKSAYEPCRVIRDIVFEEEKPPALPPRVLRPVPPLRRNRPIYPPPTSMNLSTERPPPRALRPNSMSASCIEAVPRRRVRLSDVFEPNCLPEIIVGENSEYVSIENDPCTSKQAEFFMKLQKGHREPMKEKSNGSFFGSLFNRLSSQRVKQRPKSTPGIINGSLYGYGIPFGNRISERPIIYNVS